MALDLGKNVSHTFTTEGYNYSGVVFQKGKPPLESEFNLLQELLADLSRKTTQVNSSGWVSYRKPLAEAGVSNAFYTQDPVAAIPEIAMVNGWPVLVTNTKTESMFTNKVDLSEFPLVSGNRVDGVFLEVWRGLVDEEMSGITTPTDLTQIGKLRTSFAINQNLVWVAGDNGILLKTENGGNTWVSQPTPTSSAIYSINFVSQFVGFIAGGNGTLYKTTDGGSTWTKLVSPVADDLYSLAVIGDNFVVVVGANGTILRSTDGYNFVLVLNTNQTADTLYSVCLYDTSIGWACGANGAYLRTLDGGISWTKYSVFVPDPVNPTQEYIINTKLNAIGFVNLNDGWAVGDNGTILRTTDGGLRWGDASESIYDPATGNYTRSTENLNALKVINSYPLRIALSIYNPGVVSSVSYFIDPLFLITSYTLIGSTTPINTKFTLSQYPNVEDLVTAINAVTTSTGIRVFSASLGYTETNYVSHNNTDSISGTQSTEIRVSLGNEAWVVGTNGLTLYTQTSGARWEVQASPTTFDLFGIGFYNNNYGWIVGDQGEINAFVAASSTPWTNQDTDLVTQVNRRVYLEGNNNALATQNLNNNSIQPDIRVETAGRIQIQYRIRVVESVDIANFRDAGLGSPYVFSRGPNASVRDAGSYAYQNMGTVTGDYGAWRSLCRNTVDGFSYAIPMFLVSKRNQSPYNPLTNINGTTVDSLNAVRPDGLTYEDIVTEDIVDIRRVVAAQDVGSLLERSFDNLLSGNLVTSMARVSTRGGQSGGYLTYVDEFTTSQLTQLSAGAINSQATSGITGFAGTQGVDGIPAATGTSQAIFSSLSSAIYDPRIAQYEAVYSTDPTLTGMPIPGSFTGMGTSQVVFDIDRTSPEYYNEVNYPGLTYLVRGTYIDYGKQGLSQVPSVPLQVKNLKTGQADDTYNFYGISSGTVSQTVRKLTSGLPGLTDYVEATATDFGDTLASNGSMFRLHMYQQASENTNTIIIPKNNDGYFVYAVREIRNFVDGGTYRVLGMVDADGSDTSSIVITLASTYTIASGSVIEIVAETTTASEGLSALKQSIGQTTTDRGETTDAYRSPFLATFDKSIKGVNSLYKSIVVQVTGVGPTIDLTNLPANPGTIPSPNINGNVIGLPTMNILEGLNVPYCWVKPQSGAAYFSTQIITATTTDSNGYITSIDTSAASRKISPSDTVMLVLLVKMTAFDNTQNSTAQVVYKKAAPQTLQPLPATMEVQVMKSASFMAVSNLGTGGGTPSPFFTDPLTQIPVYDTLSNESFFFNLFGLQMQSFTETQGYVTLPLRVSRNPGSSIILANSGVDNMGRTFYRSASQTLLYKAEGMSLANPRKLMVPMIVKVVSSITSPVVRGELLLAVATTYLNVELDNQFQLNSDVGTAAISLYKIPGMPILRA